jgi:hypothetical protein
MAFAASINTRFGQLHVYLAQALRAVGERNGQCRLETGKYWYRLQRTSDTSDEALFRWEYDRSHDPKTSKPPRHHAHAPARIEAGGISLDLNKLHIPTGWVTIEEVIRFLITELGHRPPCGNGWPAVLAESEEAFFEKFTGKRLKKA